MPRVRLHLLIIAIWGTTLVMVPPGGAQEPRPLTLEESLRLATERNLHLQAAKYEAAAFAEEVPKTYTDFFPKLRGDARYFVSNRPVIAIPQGSLTIPAIPPFTTAPILIPSEQQNIIAGRAWDNIIRLRIDQPLFTGFRLSSTYAVAKLDRQIGQVRLTQVRQEVAEHVKVAYFAALRASEDRQAAEARIRLHQAEIRFTENLISGGRATASSLPPLRAALAGARQETLESGQRVQIALDELKRLLGFDPSEEIRPMQIAEERVLAMELADATRLAQRHRPELKELSLSVDRAREGVTLARSSIYPQMDLFGTFEKQPEQPIHPLGEIFTAGVQATWTLWEWNRSGHERAQAEFRRLRAVSDLQDRTGAIVQEVRAAFADVKTSEGRVLALREEVEAARSAAKVAEERFRDKVGIERDVTISRIEMTRALARYRSAVYDAYLARARFERILGVEDLPTIPSGPLLAKEFAEERRAQEQLSSASLTVIPASSAGDTKRSLPQPKTPGARQSR